MSYNVVLTKTALKDLKKLQPDARRRILEKLKEMKTNPFKGAKKLVNPRIGEYRVRIGEYRIIFDIKEKTVVVLRIGHRKHIYK